MRIIQRLKPWLLAVTLAVFATECASTVRIPRTATSPASPEPLALFAHETHDSYGCHDCHTAIFPERLVSFTHADMAKAQFCGHCHDGRTAFAATAQTHCATCHKPGP